jgi:hypothetical protein
MSKFRKYLKLLVLSILSLFTCFFVENSERINSSLLMIQESKSSRSFGYLILINIGKWFLLIFGIVGLLFIFIKTFKKED